MNTEDFVTYEQALALKKLGFDYPTTHYYRNDGKLIEDYEHVGSGNTADNKYHKDMPDAPTLAQAQKWLRKEKNVLICPWPHTNYEENAEQVYEHVLYDTWDYDLWINRKDESPLKSNEFNSPEEALSAGITECLKLLENDKE